MIRVVRSDVKAALRQQASAGPLRLERSEALARLGSERFDILIIGGGITGAYAAFDAALRGHKVALVEKGDFASGTSSKSSKMIHGGLRYLQQANVRLVAHSLLERQRLRNNASFLVQRLPFIFPVMMRHGVFDRRLSLGFSAALSAYDVLGGYREGVLHRKLSRDELLVHAPTLKPEQLINGFLFYDARADDARLSLAVARSAAALGAAIANYTRATRITRDTGRVSGAVVEADGQEIVVRASVVVMATGSWLRDWDGTAPGTDAPTIRPAKGVHIALPWLKIRNTSSLTFQVPGQKTPATITRWGDSVLVGTTDTEYTGDLDHVGCTADDADVLLHAVTSSFDTDVSAADIQGSIAGTRPLVARSNAKNTAEIPRSSEVRTDPDGLVSILGGKLTIGRHMGMQGIDAAEKVLGVQRRCRTADTPILGAAGYDEASFTASGGWEDHLAERYGTESRFVSQIMADDPAMREPIVAGQPYLAAEVVYAARHEMAHTVDDVLARRTRLRLFARDASDGAARRVAGLMAPELGWTPQQVDHQVAAYHEAIQTERQLLTTNTEAQA